MEVAHSKDTQCNESFNNIVAWLAPQNKVYSKLNSLKHWIVFALGMNALGMLCYYQNIFAKLGIQMNASVLHYQHLTQMNKFCINRLTKAKMPKERRKEWKHVSTSCQRKLFDQNVRNIGHEGTYQPGLGMAAGYTDEELALATQLFPGCQKNNNNPTKKKKDPSKIKCRACKEVGHGLVTSRKCKHNKEYKEWKATNLPKGAKFKPQNSDVNQQDDPVIDVADKLDTPEAHVEQDWGKCDLLDQLPLDGNDNNDGMDKFFDAFKFMRCDSDGNYSDKEN